MAPTLAALSLALAAGFAAMVRPASHLYSSVGIDREVSDGVGGAWNAHWRVQWPGDGTVRVGGSGFHEAVRTRPLEPFDLGGLFFRPPDWEGPRRPPGSPPGFYRVGFRRPNAWAWFAGAPAWFPVPLFAAPPLLWLVWFGTRRGKRAGAPPV